VQFVFSSYGGEAKTRVSELVLGNGAIRAIFNKTSRKRGFAAFPYRSLEVIPTRAHSSSTSDCHSA
jgi:hypothetical protein